MTRMLIFVPDERVLLQGAHHGRPGAPITRLRLRMAHEARAGRASTGRCSLLGQREGHALRFLISSILHVTYYHCFNCTLLLHVGARFTRHSMREIYLSARVRVGDPTLVSLLSVRHPSLDLHYHVAVYYSWRGCEECCVHSPVLAVK